VTCREGSRRAKKGQEDSRRVKKIPEGPRRVQKGAEGPRRFSVLQIGNISPVIES